MKTAQGVRLGRPRLIDPKLAARIRRLRSKGRTLASIAAELNAQGTPTPAGGKGWTPTKARRAVLSA